MTGVANKGPRGILFYLFCGLAALGFLAAPYLVFMVAPMDPNMGFSQKIFYFHVPCAWSMFLAAMVGAVGGSAMLFKGKRWGDALCAAGAELGIIYGVLVLTTGPLWAKVAWGHYWAWDIRLTTVLVLFLSLVAVQLARRFGGPTASRLAAGLSLFGAANVPIVYYSVKLWRTIHPKTSVVSTLPREMLGPFLFSLAVFTLFFVLLITIRYRLERSRADLDELYAAAAERREA